MFSSFLFLSLFDSGRARPGRARSGRVGSGRVGSGGSGRVGSGQTRGRPGEGGGGFWLDFWVTRIGAPEKGVGVLTRGGFWLETLLYETYFFAYAKRIGLGYLC